MSARSEPLTHVEIPQFEVHSVRKDFPILHQNINGKPLVYLDNAATTQKPLAVLDALERYYKYENANVHRGVHTLSDRATQAYEQARLKVANFINAQDKSEIVFLRGCTEAINLVSQAYVRSLLRDGGEVIVTEMEHHSNIVPWQLLCEQTGAELKVLPINDNGELITDKLHELLNKKTRILAVAHISNALGTVNPVKQIIDMAHAHDVPVLLDGAQAAGRVSVDVQALNCDFYTLSGHKMYAPTGIGALYAKRELLEQMSPYHGGGEMIRKVTFDETLYAEPPYKFEAGTPNIGGAIALGAAVDYISHIGIDAIARHELELLHYAQDTVSVIDGVHIIGTARDKAGILSFVIEGVHAHDVGTIMDHEGIAIRAGHHCAMPVMQHFKLPATSRASFALYNTTQEVDVLANAIHTVQEVFKQ